MSNPDIKKALLSECYSVFAIQHLTRTLESSTPGTLFSLHLVPGNLGPVDPSFICSPGTLGPSNPIYSQL